MCGIVPDAHSAAEAEKTIVRFDGFLFGTDIERLTLRRHSAILITKKGVGTLFSEIG